MSATYEEFLSFLEGGPTPEAKKINTHIDESKQIVKVFIPSAPVRNSPENVVEVAALLKSKARE